jgi:hypothetical protein
MRRGQSGIEFIVLLGFLMIVFLAFSVAIQEQIREQQQLNQRDLSVQLADLVERELLLAQRVSPGFSREFELPRMLGNEPYTIELEGTDTLVITSSGEEYIRFLSVNVSVYPGGKKIMPGNIQRVILQKTDPYGYLYFNAECVKNDIPLKDCPLPPDP